MKKSITQRILIIIKYAIVNYNLEYYQGMTGEIGDCDWYTGCTTKYYYRAFKQYNGSDCYYWLRPALSYNNYRFRSVHIHGYLSYYHADRSSVGVAPAFRIG